WCGKAVDIRNYPLPEFREISRIESIGMSVVEPCEQPTRLECIANAIRSLWQDHRLLRVCRGRRKDFAVYLTEKEIPTEPLPCANLRGEDEKPEYEDLLDLRDGSEPKRPPAPRPASEETDELDFNIEVKQVENNKEAVVFMCRKCRHLM